MSSTLPGNSVWQNETVSD